MIGRPNESRNQNQSDSACSAVISCLYNNYKSMYTDIYSTDAVAGVQACA